MMKFIWSRGAHVNAERLKLQKELFEYNQTIYHGFPHRPSALAYDKKLNLLAIGTKEGDLRILGKAGVEFQAILKDQKKIDNIVFIKNTSQLLVKCEDNSIYLYEIPNSLSSNVNSDELVLVKSFYHFVTDSENEDKPSNHITALMVNSALNNLYVGTENGKIHFVNLKNFDVTENAISQENIVSKLPKDVSKSLGAPEIILEHPTNSDLILIGYNRGQLILWNLLTSNCEKVFVSDQLLEHACWSSNGDEFISSHQDGSYIIWNINDNIEPTQQPKIVYGPYPCKPINKIYGKSSENLIIFSGGMTRQEHGDRHTVSVFQGVNDSAKHQTLDLTSKLVDFVVVEQDTDKALIILAEEELVAIDLNDPEWSQFKLPYLSSVHSSPITFSQIYSSVNGDFIKKLEKIGSNQKTGKYSTREWPIQGGFIKEKSYQPENTLLITGHENGSVRLWNLSDIAMNPLCTINTAKFFGTDDDIVPIDSDDQNYDADEWPPFKKVGVFDPYSDDPRLGIRKVVLCLKKFSLLVAGTSGQALIFELKEEAAKFQLTRENIDLVSGLDFVWKSHECLSLESNAISFEPGYQPTSIIQLNPPASITALALNTDWNLFSAGTTHGFAVFNYETNKTISFKCTLNPAEVSNASSGNLTRKKSLRKTLRESFRKLRKGRSLRVTKKGDKSPVVSPSKSKGSKVDVSLDYRPVERQIEAKTEDGIGSVVRYLHFASAPIMNQGQFEKTLWAGTNAGNIFIYLINDAQNQENENNSAENKPASTVAPNNSVEESLENQNEIKPTKSSENKDNEVEEQSSDDKKSFNVTCQLTKEIQLKHHAPVIYIQVIDPSGHPVSTDATQINEGVYRVLICSEEQFKLFNLPTLKPYCKFKLTAHEGSKSRGIHISKFISRSDPNYFEHCIVNVNNQGDLAVFSILDLKKQLQSKCMKKEDINGISSLVFATNGEGLFLNSPSEFSRFSVSAYRIIKPNCLISETELEKIFVETTEDVNVEAEPNQSNDTNKDKGPSATTENDNQVNEQVSSKSDKNETSNSNIAENTKDDENLKKTDNVTQIAKVTEVSIEKSNELEINEEFVETREVPEESENTERKTLENGITEIKALETEPKVTVNSCKINSTSPTILEKNHSTEKICVNKNLVNVEVHYPQLNGNGDVNESVATNGNKHINLYDDDEGEGKSIDEDLDKTEENLEKSNGTPTSGIVEDDDDDDSYSDANDLNTIDAKFGKYNETKNKKNKDLDFKETEKDDSIIDSSFNITIDSVKEHYNNLVISNDSKDYSLNTDE